MTSIIALVSAIVVFFAATLLLTSAVAFAYSDWQALETFLFLALSLGFLASLTMLATTKRFKKLNRLEVFYASITMWIMLSVLAMIPFLLIEKLELAHATFEAVSAIVTLGATYQERTEISSTMSFYRGILAWQGGLLTLLLCVYVLGRYQVGGVPNRQLRLILHSSKMGNPRIAKTFFEVFVPYFALTAICAAALVLARVNPVDAINVAINIISTNGFMPINTGASVLNNVMAEIIIIIFMLIGATSLLWHRTLLSKSWHNNKENREASVFLFAVALVSIIAIIVSINSPSEYFGPFQAALNAVFDVVSIMTTTGITHDDRVGVGLPIELILALAVVGGCSYSTSGGLKVFRISAMFRHSGNEIRKLVYPHLSIANSVHAEKIELKLAKAIWSSLFIAILTIMLATLIFSFLGQSFIASLSMSVGAFSSTANLVTSSYAGVDVQMPSNAILLTLSALSLLARIELLVILAIFSRIKW